MYARLLSNAPQPRQVILSCKSDAHSQLDDNTKSVARSKKKCKCGAVCACACACAYGICASTRLLGFACPRPCDDERTPPVHLRGASPPSVSTVCLASTVDCVLFNFRPGVCTLRLASRAR